MKELNELVELAKAAAINRCRSNMWSLQARCQPETILAIAAKLQEVEEQRDELRAEIARRDEIFIPIYPDENLMNKLTDVFHDTAKIEFEEDDVYVGNPELVITALINNFFLHGGHPHNLPVDFLNSVRAEGAEAVEQKLLRMCAVAHRSDKEVIHALSVKAGEIAAQLRAGEAS